MHILVTGASGFVGRNLCASLLELGHQVRAVTSLSPAKFIPLLDFDETERLEIVTVPHGGYSETVLCNICSEIDLVVHLAALAHQVGGVNPGTAELVYRNANADLTLSLARACIASNVSRLIFLSTIGINGFKTDLEAFQFSDIPNPHSPYAVSKLEAEVGLRKLALSHNIDVVIVRPPLVYGSKAPGNFGRLFSLIKTGYPLPFGYLDNRRSLVALDNLIDLIIVCLAHPQAKNQTFLVSDDQDVSTTDLVRSIGAALNVRNLLFPVPVRLLRYLAGLVGKSSLVDSLYGSLQVDIEHTKNTLNWKPPYTMGQQLSKIAASFSNKEG